MSRLISQSLVLFTLIFSLLIISSTVMAQGTGGKFPEPIASHEFEKWLAQSGLNDELALEAAGAIKEYQASFRVLRDGPIESWLSMEVRRRRCTRS